jgi:monofunctional biosynthetic peptidoglycan transglycosylase
VRKGLEAYFTVLIELIWTKERILEVYLNWHGTGKGIYGAEAIANQHFNNTAKKLTSCAVGSHRSHTAQSHSIQFGKAIGLYLASPIADNGANEIYPIARQKDCRKKSK